MNATFTDRVRFLCKQQGKSVKQMERECGISNGYILSTAKQGSRPKPATLAKIADYLGVTPAFLLGEDEPSNGTLIPLLGRVAAGLPISAVENVIGQEEISDQLASQGEYFALRIAGDSMAPFICDGDIVVVRQQEAAESGDIVIALINGDDGVCKTLRLTESSLMLISKNPAYEPLVFSCAEASAVKILGKVVELRRSL